MNYQLVFDKAISHWKAGKLTDYGLNSYFMGAYNACIVLLDDSEKPSFKAHLNNYFGLADSLDRQLMSLKIAVKPSNPLVKEIEWLIQRFDGDLVELIQWLEITQDAFVSIEDEETVKEYDEKINYVKKLIKR